MPKIRIAPKHWGKFWRMLVASGPITRVSDEPVYVVTDRQVQLLRRKKLPFELLGQVNGSVTGEPHA